MADATSKYEGAGTTFWRDEKDQRVEINKAFSDENEPLLFAKGWRPEEPRPRLRQCPEGLILSQVALLHDGMRSLVGDHIDEYRCELQQDHADWHEDGETRWKTY